MFSASRQNDDIGRWTEMEWDRLNGQARLWNWLNSMSPDSYTWKLSLCPCTKAAWQKQAPPRALYTLSSSVNKLDSAWHWVESINPTLSQDQITQSHQTISNWYLIHSDSHVQLLGFTVFHSCRLHCVTFLWPFESVMVQWQLGKIPISPHRGGRSGVTSCGKKNKTLPALNPISCYLSSGMLRDLSESFQIFPAFWNFFDYFDFCSSAIAHDSKKTKSTLFQDIPGVLFVAPPSKWSAHYLQQEPYHLGTNCVLPVVRFDTFRYVEGWQDIAYSSQ